MQEWEYYSTELSLIRSEIPDKLGRQGWELVGFDQRNQAWFKRRRQLGDEAGPSHRIWAASDDDNSG